MRYVISIGSNECRQESMLLARRRLSELFADIRFSAEIETVPLLMQRTCMFSNQMACFYSDWCLDDVRLCLKHIECEAGRLPEDKLKEIVKLDIDVLMCGGNVIRSEDWGREYVQCGLKELNIL